MLLYSISVINGMETLCEYVNCVSNISVKAARYFQGQLKASCNQSITRRKREFPISIELIGNLQCKERHTPRSVYSSGGRGKVYIEWFSSAAPPIEIYRPDDGFPWGRLRSFVFVYRLFRNS